MDWVRTELIVGGAIYDISDKVEFLHISDVGFGMAPSQRFSVSGPNQDGVTDLGFRLLPRVIAIEVGAFGDSLDKHFNLRDQLLRLFVPQEDPLILRRTLPSGDFRQLECHYAGELNFSSKGIKGWAMVDVVALKASDPIWWDPVLNTIFAELVGGGKLSFPIGFPIGFSSTSIFSNVAISYEGSWKEYPTIKLKGPLEGPTVTNTTIDQKIEIQFTIPSGVVVTIETTPGSKKVFDDRVPSNNLIGTVSTSSNLSTFHLAASIDGALTRNNDIVLTAGGAVPSVSRITLEYFNRYIGI